MTCNKKSISTNHLKTLIVLLILPEIYSVSVKDVFTSTESLVRIPRDNKYYLGRYGSGIKNESPSARSLTLKPEDTPEKDSLQNTAVGKRCARCESGYLDRDRDRYDNKNRYDDRDTRDRRRGGYEDRYQDRYDRYDSRYEDRGSYDRYDRDRYSDRYQDRYQDRDRYDDRRYEDYDRYDRGYDRDRSRYEPRDRYYDRGVGYDNRGYDYRRGDTDRDNYRPYDETYRGTSGFDVNSGRGYYYASTRPDYGSSYGGSGGYASSWNYGGGKNDYRDRYSSGGGDGGYYRPRDPYDVSVGGGYRGTSYLYGRPSSTSTDRPTSSNDSGPGSVTQTTPQQETASG